MTLPLIVPDWPAPADVFACVTTRAGGVSVGQYGQPDGTPGGLNLGDHVGDAPAAVAQNRARLPGPARPRWLAQVHGTRVADLDHVGDDEPLPPADAAVTMRRDVACAILVADCMPVLFADRRGRVVGAAHAGWRGLASGVLEATAERMRDKVPDADLIAWIGPCIGPERFEIGPEVRAALLATDPAATGAFRAGREDRWLADLPRLAERRLRAAGVGWIGAAHMCTYDDPQRFYSFRRDGTTGRFAGLVSLGNAGAVSGG